MNLLLITLALVHFGLIEADVATLGEDEFGPFIQSSNLSMVQFFAPWCSASAAIQPFYTEAAAILERKDVPLARIDCTSSQVLCDRYAITRYPSFVSFQGNGNSTSSYEGDYTVSGFVSHLTRKTHPTITPLDRQNYQDFMTVDQEFSVIMFTDHPSDQAVSINLATRLNGEYLFGSVTDESIARMEGVVPPAMVMYKTPKKDVFSASALTTEREIYQHEFDLGVMTKFLTVAAFPTIGEMTLENYDKYTDTNLPIAYIFYRTATQHTILTKTLYPVARTFKGSIHFVTINAMEYADQARELNLDPDILPAFAVQDQNSQRYPFNQSLAIERDSILNFVQSIKNGSVAPTIKSEPVPAIQSEPVSVLVGTTFTDAVRNASQDLLVQFTASWCEHSQKFAPRYKALASLYASDTSLQFAQIDAAANDVPEGIGYFPAVKLYKRGEKTAPVVYTGDKSTADLVKFLDENGHSAKCPAQVFDIRLIDVCKVS